MRHSLILSRVRENFPTAQIYIFPGRAEKHRIQLGVVLIIKYTANRDNHMVATPAYITSQAMCSLSLNNTTMLESPT